MKSLLTRGIGLIMLIGMLGGCVTQIMPAQPLPAVAPAFTPVIALQPNATRHVAWGECPAGQGCRVVYHRTTLSGIATKIQLIPPAGETYLLPDVAVTSTGDAYVVWRTFSNVSNRYTPSYTRIPAGSTTTPTVAAIGASSASVSDAPRVVARGTTVYAIYTGVDATDSSIDLFQRRLNPLAAAGTPVVTSTNAAVSSAQGAIDSAGGIHIAYKYRGLSTGYQAVFYYGYGGVHLISNATSTTELYSRPDIAIDSNNTANVVYARYTSPIGVSIYRTTSSNTASTNNVPLDAALAPWGIVGDPHIATLGANAIVSFIARNTSTSPEVWYYSTQPSGPIQISESSSLSMPREAFIAGVDGFPVIVWRVEPSDFVGCDQHAFVWRGGPGAVAEQIHTSPEFSCSRGLDVAASGVWVAGVGLDEAPAQLPWVSFNAYMSYAPMTTR